MRIITFNCNGIRSAANKGAFSWIAKQNADIICLQEIRVHQHQLDEELRCMPGYHCSFFFAQKPGYSGVALYSREKPDTIIQGLGWDIADQEGRYIEADFGKLCVASIYLPSGTSGDERQQVKYDFMHKYLKVLREQKRSHKQYIICGDWNIAHKNIDLKNWRGNQKSSGFLPAERSWLDTLFNEVGFVDAYRHHNPDKEEYTWWSNRSRTAWENNVGWRIDYQVVTPDLADKIKHTYIYRDQKFSDHAPLIIDYNL